MSFYHEYKSCCGKDDKVEMVADLRCLCDPKFINRFLGDEVTIWGPAFNSRTGVLSCFDPETGIITLVDNVNSQIHYLCCRRITAIQRTP